MSNGALNWNGLLDLEVTPMLGDKETRATGKARAK